jgi:uncharacterized membrane protein
MLFAPKGFWSFGEKAGRDDRILKAAEEARNIEIEQILKTKLFKPSNFPAYQSNKLNTAIQYAISRHDWYEEQRTKIVNNTLSTATVVGAAIAAFGHDFSKLSLSQKSTVLNIALTTAIAIFVVVLKYQSQLDRDRPYRLVSDIRYWFFRYSLPGPATEIEGRIDYFHIATEQLNERKKYFDRLLENFELEKSIREDMEQLYILHVLQRYKSDSLQEMRWIYTYFVLLVALGFTAFIFFNL